MTMHEKLAKEFHEANLKLEERAMIQKRYSNKTTGDVKNKCFVIWIFMSVNILIATNNMLNQSWYSHSFNFAQNKHYQSKNKP